jgi:radical SAM protein (TIGR01212 family)
MYYYSLHDYAKDKFGKKLYKLALQSGCTCPNRDGKLGTAGCIFCSQGGSGEFAADGTLPVSVQIAQAKERIFSKMPRKNVGYIAYFQSFTNTYGPISRLRALWEEAVADGDVEVLSIATRPDCLGEEVLSVLEEFNQRKPVWVELGLQTIHEETARYIRRGYELPVFDKAVKALKSRGISVIVHVILGLPGETKGQMLETVNYVGRSGADGIKLQLLHVLSGTDLEKEYRQGNVQVMEMEEYFSLLGDCLSILPPDMVIHRLTGDGPKKLLVAPLWTANKKMVLNGFRKYGKEHSVCQGSRFGKEGE